MPNSKCCSRCKANLPLADFGKRTAAPDGLHPYCKQCVRDYCKARYVTHAEQIKSAAREYRARNAEAISQRDRAEYLVNRDAHRAAGALRYAANREQAKADAKDYRDARDPDVERAYKRGYRKANRHLTREWEHRRRARERASMVVPLTPAMVAAKVDYWGRMCWVCSGPFEAIDHVKPLSKGGPHILANLRPICGSCNSKKHSTWPYVPPKRTEG